MSEPLTEEELDRLAAIAYNEWRNWLVGSRAPSLAYHLHEWSEVAEDFKEEWRSIAREIVKALAVKGLK